VVFRLAVGTVLEAGLEPYPGKPTSAPAWLWQVITALQPGAIVLADGFFGSYWVIAALQNEESTRWSDCISANMRTFDKENVTKELQSVKPRIQ